MQAHPNEGVALRDAGVGASVQHLIGRLQSETFDLTSYADTIKETHELLVAGARNDYLADAIAPLQGLSRRFWFTRVEDEVAEITTGSQFHAAMLQAVIDGDADAAEAASLALNDYLVEFAYRTLRA